MYEVANWEEFQAKAQALAQKLEQFPEIASGEVLPALHKGLLLLAGYAATYPAQSPDTRYRRTGTLGRLWVTAAPRIRTEGRHVLDARIGNATPYGPYVQDPQEQVEVHRGRWQTTAQVVAARADEVNALLAQAGAKIVDKLAAV